MNDFMRHKPALAMLRRSVLGALWILVSFAVDARADDDLHWPQWRGPWAPAYRRRPRRPCIGPRIATSARRWRFPAAALRHPSCGATACI